MLTLWEWFSPFDSCGHGHGWGIIGTMKNILRLLVVLGFILGPSLHARSTKFLWSDFQFGATRYKPTWQSNASIAIAWTPMLDMDKVLLRGELGFSWPYDRAGYRFLSTNYQGFLMVPVYSLLFAEAGAGFQNWRYQGGVTHPLFSFNVILRVGEFVDRIYFGYSHFFLSGAGVNQFSSGIAVNLF